MEEVKRGRGRPKKHSGGGRDGGLATKRQMDVIKELASGKHPSFRSAVVAAGYNPTGQHYKRFIAQKGVQRFLKTLDNKSLERYGVTVTEKIMDVFMDAMAAEKIVGRHDMRIEDHRTRVEVASKIAGIMNLTQPVQNTTINQTVNNTQNNTQLNYFSTPKEERKEFTTSFIDFVRNYKKPAGSPESAREGITKREVEEGEIAE